MALDKLVDSAQLDSDLASVANAIRTKSGGSGQLAFPSGFVSEVGSIQTGITPTGTKQITITENGTTTEDVTQYASAEITANVSGGGGYDQRTINFTSYASYDSFREFLTAINLPYSHYAAIIIFKNNTTNTRAGISAMVINASIGDIGGVINRVGKPNANPSYGIDVYAGASVDITISLYEDEVWEDYL